MFKKIMMVVVVGFLLSLVTAWGKILHVPGDYPTIQKGINAAVPGDQVLVGPGTYTENIDFLGKAITVVSEKGATETLIYGNELGSVVTCTSGEDENSILEGFTLTQGYADFGGGMYNCGSSPTVTNCTFTKNVAKIYGGGMCNEYSDPKVTHCSFSNGKAYSGGGGMCNYKSNPIIHDCTFTENTTQWHGGGMWNGHSDSTLTHCTFAKNTAGQSGGGVISIASKPTMTNCDFIKNTAPSAGGGMDNSDSSATLTDCTFLENYGGHGGGMSCSSLPNATLIRCSFIANEAQMGGGMFIGVCEPKVSSTLFRANTAVYAGGGVCNMEAKPTMTHCIFTGNSVTSADNYHGGGGMHNFESNPTITNCAFNENWATGLDAYGGGMNNLVSSPTVSNCTFFENEAGSGGGMSNWGGSNPTASNCTFFDNQADSGGGICLGSYGNTTVTNSILWDNDALAGPEIWIGISASPSTLTIRHSDVKGGQSSVHINGGTLAWGPGMMDADPLFVDSTRGDLHLTCPSPCKDTGSNNEVTEKDDFEGDPRIVYGTVDMGADEFHTHLYHTGDATPGGTVEIKLVGKPKTKPVLLWVGSGVLGAPIPTQYGDWYLDLPILLTLGLGSIASPSGVSVLSYTFDLSFPAMEIPLQSLIGMDLTNLCIVAVD